jgi:hypothetical protein
MTTDNGQAAQSPESPVKGEEAGVTATRRPYTAPTLTVHGSVEGITGLVGSVPQDGLFGSQL